MVEDNEELKAFLKSILSENYTVITASNGEEGLQHAVDDLPDLIISDVMMPVMDGLEMIRRNQREQQYLPYPHHRIISQSLSGRPHRRIGTRH